MLTKEWTFIKIRAAEFELHKLCATRSITAPKRGEKSGPAHHAPGGKHGQESLGGVADAWK
jgi:hypothetical protein